MTIQTSFQTYENPDLVGEGCFGLVYRISREHVAKVCSSRKTLEHELEVAQELYERGFPVPKVEGIFPVFVPAGRITPTGVKKISDALIMEFVPGRTGEQLSDGEYLATKLEVSNLVERARSLGFVPGRDVVSQKNYILNSKTRKVTMIDFGDWKMPDGNGGERK